MKRPRTDSPVAQPVSVVRQPGRAAGAVLRSVFRFRCPHCGHGPVVHRYFGLQRVCSGCGFRFRRDKDESYFNGAIFVNYMLSAGLFVVSFVVTVMATTPHVPWDTIAVVAPVGAVAAVLLFQPIARMIWLTVDTMIRPVTKDELEIRARDAAAGSGGLRDTAQADPVTEQRTIA